MNNDISIITDGGVTIGFRRHRPAPDSNGTSSDYWDMHVDETYTGFMDTDSLRELASEIEYEAGDKSISALIHKDLEHQDAIIQQGNDIQSLELTNKELKRKLGRCDCGKG